MEGEKRSGRNGKRKRENEIKRAGESQKWGERRGRENRE